MLIITTSFPGLNAGLAGLLYFSDNTPLDRKHFCGLNLPGQP